MVHHICLLEAKGDVSPEKLENLIVEIRIRLLKIPEVTNLRVGKRIDVKQNPYTFFFSLDVENMDKLRIFHESAIYTQFQKQVLGPFVSKLLEMNYEMEPGKDVQYS
jgi:hypothetical protein